MKHMTNKHVSETKSDSIAKSSGLVLTDNNHNKTVDNAIVLRTMDILRTVREEGSNDVNSNFVGHRDGAEVSSDIVHVQNSEDRISTGELKSASPPLVLSTGSNMKNQVKDIYDNSASYQYFLKNASGDENDTGPAFLVGQAVTGTNLAHKSMRKNDILLHLLLAKFTATLTVDQKQQFAMILELIMNKNDEESDGNNMKEVFQNSKNDSGYNIKKSIIKTRFPHDIHTMKRYYHGGVKSIIMNLPQPKVRLVDNHAYVSIRQCIADFFGNGFYPQQPSLKQTDLQHNLTDCVSI